MVILLKSSVILGLPKVEKRLHISPIQMRIPVCLYMKAGPVFKILLLVCACVRVFAWGYCYKQACGWGGCADNLLGCLTQFTCKCTILCLPLLSKPKHLHWLSPGIELPLQKLNLQICFGPICYWHLLTFLLWRFLSIPGSAGIFCKYQLWGRSSTWADCSTQKVILRAVAFEKVPLLHLLYYLQSNVLMDSATQNVVFQLIALMIAPMAPTFSWNFSLYLTFPWDSVVESF